MIPDYDFLAPPHIVFGWGRRRELAAELLLPESWLGTVRAGQNVTLVPVAGGSPTPPVDAAFSPSGPRPRGRHAPSAPRR